MAGSNYVAYNLAQSRSDSEQAQARNNIGAAGLSSLAALQEQIDNIEVGAVSGYTPKGPSSVATLNGLTGQENGWLYTMTDAGTLTDGSVAVVAGDTVAWDETNSVWYKTMNYAPAQYGTNEVQNLSTTITAFRTGDVIPVDGPSGTAKMGKDDLLKETSQNALAGNVVEEFDESGNTSYVAGTPISRNGKTYIFKVNHSGSWNADDVERIPIAELFDSTISREDAQCTQASTYDETKLGYYATTSGYSQNALYDTFIFEAKHDGKIYPTIHSNSYFSITIFNNSLQNSGTRYRKVAGGEDTLPTEENPASFVRGNYIAITTATGIDFSCALVDYVVFKTLNSNVVLSQSQLEQAENAIGKAVDFEDIDEVFTASSTYDETKRGYYATTSGYSQSALYDTFIFEATKDGTFYPRTFSNSYFSVVVFDNSSQNSGTRYRKVAGGEDTLPTEENPASLIKGNYIAITTATGIDFSVVFNDYKIEKVFEGDIIFSQGQKDQIVALQKNKVVCKFINASGDGNSTQRFEVHVPVKVGYVKYQFVHSVSVEKNADCWRIQSAVAVDDDFAYRFDLTKNGEWECAIRLVGRDDFSGGIVHGNEVLIDASFWADGEKLDLQTLPNTPFLCSKFRIATSSHLYDNADGTTNFADHGCEHVFSEKGCEITQSVKFIVNSDIMTAYLAMGLPSAAITDHYFADSEISGGSAVPVSQKIVTSDLQKFFVYGDSSGIAFTMELLKDYPFLQNPYRGLLVHTGYNKVYFVIRYNNSYSVAANDLWLSRHRVNFEIGK